MNEILLVIAILPVILLGMYIYKKDKHKEPRSLLVKLFVSGIISTFMVVIVSLLATFIFPFLNENHTTMTAIEFFIYIFIFIALLEEVCKWLMSYYIGYKSKEFDEFYDIVVYAVFVALGFAAFENILYVFDLQSIQVGIYRGLLAIPGHVCDGIAMGYYLSLAKYHEQKGNKKEEKRNKIKSILIPAIYHGIYDYCCLSESNIILITFIVFIIFLYTTSLKKIKLLSQENSTITNQNNYCPICGTRIVDKYCPKCGFKNERGE